MTLPEVEAQCKRLGWHLLRRTLYTLAGVETVEYLVIDAAKPEPLGVADTPRSAYLAACERAGVTPF